MTIELRNGREPETAIAEAVLAHLRQILPEEPPGGLSLETSLDELGVDSVAVMGAFGQLEEAFGMRFREEWLDDLVTCGDLVACVTSHMTDGRAAPPPRAARPAAARRAPDDVPVEHYDVELFAECKAFHKRLAQTGLDNPFFPCAQRVVRPMATIDGQDVVNYTSFDYLGLAGDPRVIAAAKEAIDRFGTSASASRLVGGDNTILQEIDSRIAGFVGTEAAAVFPSGYGTNASLFGHLFGEGDLILHDELAHNSIATGALLSKAGRRPFPHNDLAFLDRLLGDLRSEYRRVVVAIEGVYSMDGDYPDLPRLIEIKKRHRALLFVDEAHSVGVMGPNGRGICEHFDVDPADGDLWMGTISKALASSGGYLAGRATLIQYLKYTTPSFVFATACSPGSAGAALAALWAIAEEPQRVTRLRDRSALFLKLARERGLNTGASGGTPVVPIILGDSHRCVRVSNELRSRGIHAQPILYPAVRECAARVRFFITAEHSPEQIAHTVDVLAEIVDATEP